MLLLQEICLFVLFELHWSCFCYFCIVISWSFVSVVYYLLFVLFLEGICPGFVPFSLCISTNGSAFTLTNLRWKSQSAMSIYVKRLKFWQLDNILGDFWLHF